MFLSPQSHGQKGFCSNCHPPQERHDLAPSPLTPRMDGGYSFFGPLIEFPRGCERCRLLRDGVLHFARGFRDDVDPANIRLECSSLTREVSGFPSEISFEFTDMPEMSSIAIQVNDWAYGSRSHHTLDTQTVESLAVIRTWLHSCDSIHEEKCYSRSQVDQPSRLLDISSNVIRLVETKRMKEKTSLLAELETYTALSHCWGREATITTTVSNFRTMKAGFPITALSKTFRDAIEVTRRLQMRYIWIDSLCIIQDDQKDWEIEAARMGTVYANAVLTIAATRSADGRGGCLATTRDMSYIWQPRSHLKSVQESQTIHVRHEDIWSHLHVKSTQFERWFILRPSYDVRYLSRKDASGAIIDAGFPLFTRAWFLQERLLSPRVLHFGHMELFWECRCATWTHCIGPQPLPPPDTQGNQSERIHPDYKSSSGSPTEPEMKKPRPRKESEYPIAKLRTMFSALVSEDSSRTVQRGHSAVFEQSSWNLLIEEYTRLHLTRESDRLPALSGIAAAQEARSEYLAGIWAENLPAGLLWTIDTSTASLARRPVKYRAPSWTWASIDGPIRYRDRLNTTRKDWDIVPPHTGYQVARVHSFSCTPEGLDPHGCVKAGYIDLEGYIGTARVTQLYQEKSNTVCVVTQEGTSRRQKFYLDVPLALCRAEPAEIAQGDTISLLLVECEKLPVSLGYAHGYRVMVLVLRRSISVPVAYERVGLICPADDIALYFSEYTSGAADIGDDTSMFDEASVWFEGKGFVKIV